jgi:putative Mn2+ efflux pump MntP
MSFIELFVIAVGLSMDAFAVSVCKGLSVTKAKPSHYLTAGLYFGGFQALMPLVGWLLGSQFAQMIQSVDHWIVFFLLGGIGGKMIWDAFHEEEADASADPDRLDYRELTVLAVATSIDALAVGISFAFLEVRVVPSVLLIGLVTFLLCVGGVRIGHRFGARYSGRATLCGGVILILIGLRILLEHLGVL